MDELIKIIFFSAIALLTYRGIAVILFNDLFIHKWEWDVR
jgi:hypothetical protein